jgi:hypothetical protein
LASNASTTSTARCCANWSNARYEWIVAPTKRTPARHAEPSNEGLRPKQPTPSSRSPRRATAGMSEPRRRCGGGSVCVEGAMPVPRFVRTGTGVSSASGPQTALFVAEQSLELHSSSRPPCVNSGTATVPIATSPHSAPSRDGSRAGLSGHFALPPPRNRAGCRDVARKGFPCGIPLPLRLRNTTRALAAEHDPALTSALESVAPQ